MSGREPDKIELAACAVGWSRRHRYIYLLVLPGTAFLLLFYVAPIWGLLLAFNDYNPMLGLFRSRWVGVKNFTDLLAVPELRPDTA